DGAGAVQAGDPFPERKARTRPYLSFETRRDGDHQPRRHQRAFARRERNGADGAQIQAGRSAGRVRRQRQRIAASCRDAHHFDPQAHALFIYHADPPPIWLLFARIARVPLPWEQEASAWLKRASASSGSRSSSKKAHIGSMEKYRALYDRSVSDPDGFWNEQAERITWFKKWKTVSKYDFHTAKIEWFIGGKLNASANCLDRHLKGPRRDKPALVWEGDSP